MTISLPAFPVQPWLPFCIRPSSVIINALNRRRMLSARRRREPLIEIPDDEWRERYNLPRETHRSKPDTSQWQEFRRLNSYRATRKQARAMALKWRTEIQS